MITKSYAEIDPAQWQALIDGSPDGWLYQDRRYIDWAVVEGNVNHSFGLFTDHGELLAVCPLYEKKDTWYHPNRFVALAQKVLMLPFRLFGRRGPFDVVTLDTGFSGFVIQGKVGIRARKKYTRALVAAIDDISKKRRAENVTIRCLDHTDGGVSGSVLPSLWMAGVSGSPFYPQRLFSRIDLTKDAKQIWSEIDEDCRAEINRARRENVVVQCNPDDGLARFFEIHAASWTRTTGGHLPKAHFEGMIQSLGEHVHIFVASHEGQDVAAIMVHAYKNAVFYYSAGSLIAGQKLKANNLLLFTAIEWAKSNDYKWFGVGIFDAYPGGNAKEYQVGQYKAQFSTLYTPALEFRRHYSLKSLHRSTAEQSAHLRTTLKGKA